MTSRSIVSHSNMVTRIGDKTEYKLLAIGGSKHFEMLTYNDAQSIRVPVITPVTFEENINPITERPFDVDTYRVMKLGTGTDEEFRYFKLVWVHESLSDEQATESLKDGLLRMFVMQAYA